MMDKFKIIGSSVIDVFLKIGKVSWEVMKFIFVTILLRVPDHLLGKIELWFKSTKLRHWIYALITFILIVKSIDYYGILELNTLYILLYFTYTWSATYLLKYLNINRSIRGDISRFISVTIFAVTFVSSLFVIPLFFDMIYYKGLVYIENGSFVTILMFLLIFTSPSILIIGVRGLKVTINDHYNYRKYVLIVLTVITVMKVTNDFESLYTEAYNSYLCVEEERSEYCNEQSNPYVTFETYPTLWMMNEVVYQSMVIIFLLNNVISKKKYSNINIKIEDDTFLSS